MARRGRVMVLVGLSALAAGLGGRASAATPPGGTVSNVPITATDLLAGTTADGLTANGRFAVAADAGPAHSRFEGTLAFAGTPMRVRSDAPGGGITNPVLGKDTTFFPDVSIGFFTVGDRLVPTTENVIRNGVLPGTRSYWDVIVQPGRVWSQPGDGGWSRASFPFSLVNSIEGETHTGLALFLFRGDQVSPVRFQIVQQTSPYYVPEYFTAWGTSAARSQPGGIADLAGDVRRFRQQQAARLPVRPWSDLAASVPPAVLDGFTSYPDVMQSAVVRGGLLYRTDCPTAAGPFPYCDDVRYGVWSETKTAMMNIALLRLAQKYGRGFLDQPIADYVPAAASGGWQDVTFRDLANMASGHGPAGQPTCYLCDYDRWYVALSREDKTLQALDYPRFTAAGMLFNYRDQDAYLLGIAEDAFLKSHEGPSASIWELVRREVYAPLGIHHAPSNSTVEPDGSQGHPLMAYGYYPTLDDLAKISLLYQYRGAWNARQLLDRELVRELLPSPPGPPSGALPASSDESAFYELNWWFQRARSTEGCTRFLPQMEGWGGNTVTLLPGHMVVLRMRNLWVDSPHPQTSIDRLADALTSMCP